MGKVILLVWMLFALTVNLVLMVTCFALGDLFHSVIFGGMSIMGTYLCVKSYKEII
jgi:hypothetical protein